MFLEKLEIFGFKSIPHKLSVKFGTGITGIVGPNGCGKSNISDAIRWVLGEQSARLLRGHSMEDVIFNGTAARKPLGMAEVFLTFTNHREVAGVDYTTVTVGRRLYRSGQSDYVINKKPCRLRDVKDLLLDTGIGTSGYSLIAREMVDAVLADDSGQRRVMLEEAAGITKYKARKHEALLKLKATEGDLVRLADIIREVERETHALGRQVGRARRYKRTLERIRHLDLALGRQRVHDLAARRDELVQGLSAERAALEGERARLVTSEVGIEERRLRQADLEHALKAAVEDLDQLDRQLAEWTSEVRVLRERQTSIETRIGEAEAGLGRLADRQTTNERGREASAAEHTRVAAEVQDLNAEVAAREALRSDVERQYRTFRTELGEKKQLRIELVEDHVERRSALGELKRRREDLLSRQAEREREQAAIAGERDLTAAERERVAADHAGATANATATRGELEAAESRFAELAAMAEISGLKLLERSELAAAHESRLEVLHDLRRRYEGFARGVQTLLAAGRPAGTHGTVAELLRVPAELTEAVEAALGNAVGTIVVDEATHGAGFIDQLRAGQGGRAAFLPLSGLTSERRREVATGDGILGLASGLVEAQSPGLAAVADYLLGDVVVVRDRTVAQRLVARPEAAGFRVVTLDGELWTRGGVIAGGAGSGRSVLSREQEIVATEAALGPLKAEIAAMKQEEAELKATREQSAAALKEFRSRLDQEIETAFSLDRRRNELELAAEHKSAIHADLATAIQGLAAELAQLAASEVTLGAALDDARRVDQSSELSIVDLEAEVVRLEEERDRRLTEEQASRLRLSAAASRAAELLAEAERLEQEKLAIEAEITRLAQESTTGAASLGEIGARILEHEEAISGAVQVRGEKENRVHECETAEGQARAEVVAEERTVREARHGFDSLRDRVHEDELELERAHGEIEATASRIREEYGLELLETNELLAEEETPEGAGSELNQLRDRLRRLGPVNLLAIEQYDEVRQRFEFLSKQRDDLVSAREELLSAIDKINDTASNLFLETFTGVKANFSRVFSTLFEGGEADVSLEGDSLDGGIEITARPRGKLTRSIRMMSGGERALTAISFLFAIYLVKPSPFCIMDEVDAPLDDANIDRFVKLLQQFEVQTQFIVITHNKRSMEACERLYGVTMEEPGVSKLVSVRFEHGELAEGEEVGEGESEGGAGEGDGEPGGARAEARPILDDEAEPEPAGVG
jgi:chromosome segregation protein